MIYTPTTEEVRGGYAYDGWLHKPVQVHLNGFDRWLREERNKARLEMLEDMRDTLWAYGPKGAMTYLNRMIELYR